MGELQQSFDMLFFSVLHLLSGQPLTSAHHFSSRVTSNPVSAQIKRWTLHLFDIILHRAKALLHSKDKMRVFSTEQIHSSGGMWQHTRSRCCVRNTLWLKEWVQTHRAPAEYSPTDLSMHYLGNKHYPMLNIYSYTHRTIPVPLYTHLGQDALETMCILTKFKRFQNSEKQKYYWEATE